MATENPRWEGLPIEVLVRDSDPKRVYRPAGTPVITSVQKDRVVCDNGIAYRFDDLGKRWRLAGADHPLTGSHVELLAHDDSLTAVSRTTVERVHDGVLWCKNGFGVREADRESTWRFALE